MDHCSGAMPRPMGTTATQRELSAAIGPIEGARSVIRFDSVCFDLDGEKCELGFKIAHVIRTRSLLLC